MTRWSLVIGGVVLVISLVFDILLRDFEHAHYWWDKVPGFDIIFGFIGVTVIVLISKTLGKKLVQRAEEYYDKR